MRESSTADVLLVDGQNLLFRSGHVFQDLSAIEGGEEYYTGAIYGFLKILHTIQLKYGGLTVVCWEGGKRNFRHEIYPDYKRKDRNKLPDDHPVVDFVEGVYAQIDGLKTLLSLIGIRQALAENYEADDVLGTLAKKLGEHGTVNIYTTDKDLLQCVTDNVWVISPNMKKKGQGEIIFNPDMVESKFDILPEQWIDYLALKGDKGDNIPGLQGCGEKTAVEILQTFGDLETAIEKISNEECKLRKNIIKAIKSDDGKGMIELSKRLATICCDIEEIGWIQRQPDRSKVIEIFKRFQFKSLLQPTVLHGLMRMGQ